MPFPYNDLGQTLNEQGILAGVAGVSAGQGLFRVSSLTAAAVSQGDAANLRVSAIQDSAANLNVSAKSGDGGTLRTSAIQGDAGVFRVSAIQADAGNLMISARSGDAALLRMSAIGGTTGDRTLVDGYTQTVSAVIVSSQLVDLSGLAASARRALIMTPQVEDAAENAVSAKSGDAGTLLVSAKQGDGASLRVSAIQDGAAALNVSAKSGDGGTFRVSGLSPDSGTFLVSAKQGDAGLVRVSGIQGDGANLRISAIQDGAAALNVSAKSGDGGTLRTSALQGDAANLRISAFNSAVATNTGALSLFSTSAGIAQTSAIKSSGGRLYAWALGNPAGVDQYLAIFNASATTSVTLGTTVPDMRIYVPTLGGSNIDTIPGIGMSNGIVIAVVSGSGGDGSTAGASAMRVNLFYA